MVGEMKQGDAMTILILLAATAGGHGGDLGGGRQPTVNSPTLL
jgi:hypothetical protein